MKRALLITLTIPLLMGLNGIGAIGQNYGDDIYYTPSQSKKEREAARKANAEREAALRAEWAKQRALEENYADDDEVDTSDADIDAYNRRGTDKNQLKRGYAFGKNKYGKKQRRAGTYSSRIARFHDPATIITDSRDGNVVVIIDNDRHVHWHSSFGCSFGRSSAPNRDRSRRRSNIHPGSRLYSRCSIRCSKNSQIRIRIPSNPTRDRNSRPDSQRAGAGNATPCKTTDHRRTTDRTRNHTTGSTMSYSRIPDRG